MSTEAVRPPAVAGRFYPGERERLRAVVSRLLGGERGAVTAAPKALIAPHAGYAYSGVVAGAAFATMRSVAPAIARVVLIGPTHYFHLDGIAAPAAAAFETPLGRVPIDRDALRTLAGLPVVRVADAPHRPEHALEVELPFLQVIRPSDSIIPLLIGEAEPDDVAMVLRRLWDGPETLIVVSSDLSHDHDGTTA